MGNGISSALVKTSKLILEDQVKSWERYGKDIVVSIKIAFYVIDVLKLTVSCVLFVSLAGLSFVCMLVFTLYSVFFVVFILCVFSVDILDIPQISFTSGIPKN